MRWVLVLALLVVSTVASMPASGQAAGQFQPALDLRVESQPTSPLVPNGAPQPIVIRWTYTFRESSTAILAQPSGGTKIHFTPAPACESAGVIVTGPSTVDVRFKTGAGTTDPSYSDIVVFHAAAAQDAPGETIIKCHFGAFADAVNSQVIATHAAPVTAQVRAAYLGILQVEAPGTLQEATPGSTVAFELRVANLGNSRTTAAFTLADGPGGDWRAVVPADVMVESVAQGGAETAKVVRFTVTTPAHPGWNNQEATFQLVVVPISVVAPDQQGDPVTINLLVRSRGCVEGDGVAADACRLACAEPENAKQAGCEHVIAAKASPAGSVGLVAALAGAAMLMRRRAQRLG